MLRLLVRRLPRRAARSPPTTILPLPFRSPLAGDRSSTTSEPTVYSRGLSSKPDGSCSSLSTLTSHGIPVEQATAILAKYPRLRHSDPKILKPKLEFLLNAGLTSVDMAEVLTTNPSLLRDNLDRSIAPSVHLFESILPSKDALVRVLKHTNWLHAPNMEANIKVLKAHGVPDAMVVRLLLIQPMALARSEEDFAAAVERVKELGLTPTSSIFVKAVGIMSYMSRSSFQRKLDLYRELGWSEEAVYAMFKRFPQVMSYSDEKIRANVGYFVEKLEWGPELLKANPSVLGSSLERRIIPRCAVLSLLMVKGLLKKNTPRLSRFIISEKDFFEKFVRKYEEEAPEVVNAYQGKIEFQEWEWLKDEKESSSGKKS